jgi:formylglycine-generating enzyme required for sulfatase activity
MNPYLNKAKALGLALVVGLGLLPLPHVLPQSAPLRQPSPGTGVPKGPAGVPLPAGAFGSYSFEVPTVDLTGKEINRRRGNASFYTEDANGVVLEMVEIPAGSYQMGTSPSDLEGVLNEYRRWGDDKDVPKWVGQQTPQHLNTVASFYIGKYDVTQAQWSAVSRLPKVKIDLVSDPSHFKGDNRPVETVNWVEAVEFCARLSRATRREYRLPTEAEWEYAARAGTTTQFAFGDTITTELANFDGEFPYGQAGKGKRRVTTDVGSFGVANGFGLYDMHGNVEQWCQDVWHDGYEGAQRDGSAWLSGEDLTIRVARGGSWGYYAYQCRSAYRARYPAGFRNNVIGLRVVASGRK